MTSPHMPKPSEAEIEAACKAYTESELEWPNPLAMKRALTAASQARAGSVTMPGDITRLVEIIDRCNKLFSIIRGDWTDPRSECREGWSLLAEAKTLLSAAPPAPALSRTQVFESDLIDRARGMAKLNRQVGHENEPLATLLDELTGALSRAHTDDEMVKAAEQKPRAVKVAHDPDFQEAKAGETS